MDNRSVLHKYKEKRRRSVLWFSVEAMVKGYQAYKDSSWRRKAMSERRWQLGEFVKSREAWHGQLLCPASCKHEIKITKQHFCEILHLRKYPTIQYLLHPAYCKHEIKIFYSKYSIFVKFAHVKIFHYMVLQGHFKYSYVGNWKGHHCY